MDDRIGNRRSCDYDECGWDRLRSCGDKRRTGGDGETLWVWASWARSGELAMSALWHLSEKLDLDNGVLQPHLVLFSQNVEVLCSFLYQCRRLLRQLCSTFMSPLWKHHEEPVSSFCGAPRTTTLERSSKQYTDLSVVSLFTAEICHRPPDHCPWTSPKSASSCTGIRRARGAAKETGWIDRKGKGSPDTVLKTRYRAQEALLEGCKR